MAGPEEQDKTKKVASPEATNETSSAESVEKSRGALFIIRRAEDGKFLLVQRDEHCKYYPLQWSFPGEHSQGEESPEEAMVRGASEELSLTLSKEDAVALALHPQPHAPGTTTQPFLIELPVGQVPVLNEGKELRWFSLDEIRAMDLGFGHNVLVPQLDAYIKSTQP